MLGFKKDYMVEVLHECGGITKVILHGTKKEIAKQLEYYKSKAYWYDEMGGIMLIMKTNQPI